MPRINSCVTIVWVFENRIVATVGEENDFAKARLLQTRKTRKFTFEKWREIRPILSLITKQPKFYLLVFIFQQIGFMLPTARLHMMVVRCTLYNHRFNQRYPQTTPHLKPRSTLLMWNHQRPVIPPPPMASNQYWITENCLFPCCFAFVNTFSLPTRHILKLGQDHLASLFDTQGTPLA